MCEREVGEARSARVGGEGQEGGSSTYATTRASARWEEEEVSLTTDRGWNLDGAKTDEATVRDLAEAGALGVGEFLQEQADVSEGAQKRPQTWSPAP